MQTNPQVDNYFASGCGRCPLVGTPQCKVHNWPNEMQLLRSLLLECGLTEELKWKMPCYTINGKNVIMLAAFKEYCSLSFFKGALLKDTKQLLQLPGENTQTVRMLKYNNLKDVVKQATAIKAYIKEAIELEKKGVKTHLNDKPAVSLAPEFEKKLNEMPALKKAFYALTPGRQRAYNIYFSAPKQSKTRETRIEKYIPQILKGIGFYN